MKQNFSKVAYAIIAVACMVACNNFSHNQRRITKGDKSKMDSISYCIGFKNSMNLSTGKSDVRLDWNKVAEVCEQVMLTPYEEHKDSRHLEAAEICVRFFDSTRIARLTKIRDEQFGKDAPEDSIPDLDKIDIFESAEERMQLSWALGYDLGHNFRRMPYTLQAHWFKQGIIDGALAENRHKAMDINAYVQYYDYAVLPLMNAEASAKWLSHVGKELNVLKTKNGVLYRIEDEGDTENKPNPYSKVTVNYEISCYDGHMVDATSLRDKPAVLQMERLIKGWAEGLRLIGKGGEITLWIPAHLAYGKDGNSLIGPNEALKIDVELLEVESPNIQVQSADLGPAPSAKKSKK